MAKNREEYDWLNDPFDEKKAEEERQQAQMSGCSRIGVLVAVVLVVCIIVAFSFVTCSALTMSV